MMLFDSLQNFITGLRTSRDKSSYNQHIHNVLTIDQLMAAYRGNWICRKAVDIIPFDMLRAWRAWQTKDADLQALENTEKAFGLQSKLMDALIRARLFGGAVIVVVTAEMDPSRELSIDSIGRGGIKALRVLSRNQITAGDLSRDIFSPYFMQPTYYSINGDARSTRIHPSRVIRLLGAPIPDETLAAGENQGWSDSVLQSIFDAANDATSVQQHVASLVPEAKQDIISIPGLADLLITDEDTEKVKKRFANAALLKSMFGILLLDGNGQGMDGEVYAQKQINFSQLPELAKHFLMVAAAAADIPATRFLSQSPTGLNATGDSDTRNHYDNVAARQSVELGPQIARLDRMLIRHALGQEPDGLWYSWNPLYQPSDKEKAEVGKIKAETAKTLADSALVPDEVLAEGVKGMLIDSGLFSGIEAAYDTHAGPLVDAEEPANPDDLGPDGLPLNAAQGGNVASLAAARARRGMADAAPNTLYVSRKLKNGSDLLEWARSQGFADLYPSRELHVTIVYSRQALDWMKVGQTWQGEELKISSGGPRVVELFGDTLVLSFASSELQWRHREAIEAGASHDFPEYQPHVSFATGAGSVDISKVVPYNGPLVFGPEIFEPINTDWKAKLSEG